MQLLTHPSADAEFVDFTDSGSQVVASYPIYDEAQQAIDRLADSAFPVQYSEIVGRNVRLVERVTVRMSDGRAATAGAVTGAWFGLFIGLLVRLFTFGPAWTGLILGGLLIGSVSGALFGFLAHRMGSGRHDFASLRSLAANRYDVTIADAYADRARQLLSPLA
ncbi:MAG TPA: general stress protein [Solirubrobacteraceae bacterium]|jgi:hypothetical protein|nr:general stress protein [Solirubrobacteraceae bacterium]